MRTLTIILLTTLIFSASCRNDNTANNSRQQNAAQNSGQNSGMNKNSVGGANAVVQNNSASANSAVPVYGYEVVNVYKHDPKAFTEGLFFQNGFLYESTGSPDDNGQSSLRKIDLATGDIKQKRKLDAKYFGEGATVLNGKIYQMTWENGVCFVYDEKTFEPLANLQYQEEGWGLTTDGTHLIMSDGSHQIRFRDPADFHTVRTINVFNNGKPQMHINELEFIKGEIWANIWHSEEPQYLGKENYIARIDPRDGKILSWVDLGGISPQDSAGGEENTLNGIAYDQENDRIFVTGKNWKKLFEIKLKDK